MTLRHLPARRRAGRLGRPPRLLVVTRRDLADPALAHVARNIGDNEAVTLSDRVVVLSARPGVIRTIHEIDIKRPRNVFKV